MNIVNILLLIAISYKQISSPYPYHAQQKNICLKAEEKKLYDLLMAYRKEKNLPPIPLSASLTFVAQSHVYDLQTNKPNNDICNLHSWSDKGKWSPCCYTSDHARAQCMWDKPKELTSYTGNGYEISYYTTGQATAPDALKTWKNSPGHNSVIINSDIWSKPWNAIGIGISKNYAVVWFGHLKDLKPSPKVCN
ncbi:MAG: CAP domain-containing protein [Cytophagaceae bacterium]|nr:CAP domain-containing protein [Cytophagaceae bacterium]MDW8455884.1 CAP domain-containing protein [Cytophagaceae bacterium]